MSASIAPRRRPCARCGHWHGQTMIKRVRIGFKTYYRAAHATDADAYSTRRPAELDQCDAWAREQPEGKDQ